MRSVQPIPSVPNKTDVSVPHLCSAYSSGTFSDVKRYSVYLTVAHLAENGVVERVLDPSTASVDLPRFSLHLRCTFTVAEHDGIIAPYGL